MTLLRLFAVVAGVVMISSTIGAEECQTTKQCAQQAVEIAAKAQQALVEATREVNRMREELKQVSSKPKVHFLRSTAQSNSSEHYIDFPKLSQTLVLNHSTAVVVNFAGTFYSSTGQTNGHVKLVVDGREETAAPYISSGGYWQLIGVPLSWGGTLSPGNHTIKIMWARGSGTGAFESRDATMTIIVFE